MVADGETKLRKTMARKIAEWPDVAETLGQQCCVESCCLRTAKA